MKEHFLTILRDRDSDLSQFRSAAQKLASLAASEISSQLQLAKQRVETPLGSAAGAVLKEEITLIPILRAGLVLLPPFQQLFDSSAIGFIGIKRDEQTALPHLYYEKLPPPSSGTAFLLDPMLATGGTANLALDRLKARGTHLAKTFLVTLLASPEGINTVKQRHPEVKIYTVRIDEKINAKKFIVPGVGDFGDRYFGN